MTDARYVGRMPLTLRPGYRLLLGFECFEDTIPFLLDNIVVDSAPLCRPVGRGSMKTLVMMFLSRRLLTEDYTKPKVGPLA
jgi:hypothetical protein